MRGKLGSDLIIWLITPKVSRSNSVVDRVSLVVEVAPYIYSPCILMSAPVATDT